MTILIVGLGSIGRKHVNVLKQLVSTAKIFALRTNSNSLSENGINNIFSISELPETPEFAIISNPTSIHADTILSISKLKCPLFIEKPLFHVLNEVNMVLPDQINQLGIATYIACNLRFHPIIQFLKQNLNANQRINEVSIYCGSDLREWRKGQDHRKSYSVNPELGGGVHLDLIHELDYTYWLFGKPNTSSRIISSKSSLNIGSMDYANYVLQYHEFNISIMLNYYRPKPKRTIEIVFEDKVWNANLLTAEIVDENDQLIFIKEGYNPHDTYLEQMKYFLDCINTEKPTFNTILNGLEVLQICLDDKS